MMIKIKNIILSILLLFSYLAVYPQVKAKSNLYLYFSPDSNSYKLIREQTPSIINKQYFPDKYEVFGLDYTSDDGKYYVSSIVFSTININRYSVTDSVSIKKLKIVPFKNLRFLKGIYYDTSDKKNFPYARVFIIEQITKSQFKIIEVHSYIGSDTIQKRIINQK